MAEAKEKSETFQLDKVPEARMAEIIGTTQRDLAENLDITASMICKYEAGMCQPRLKVVVRLEEAFCIERGGLYIVPTTSDGVLRGNDL